MEQKGRSQHSIVRIKIVRTLLRNNCSDLKQHLGSRKLSRLREADKKSYRATNGPKLPREH